MSKKTSMILSSLAFMRGNILVLTITRILGQFGRSMAFPYASLYILSLGGEPAQIGLINSLAPLAGLIVFPLGGYITDRAGRVRLIGLAGFFSAFVFLLYVFAQSWHIIAVAAFLRGFMAIQFPPQSAIIADSLAPADRGRGIALMNSLGGAPSMFAPYVAGVLLEAWGVNEGMRYLYGFLGMAYIIGALVNLRFLQETSIPADVPFSAAEVLNTCKQAYACIPDTLRRLSRPLRALALVVVLGFVANAIAGPFWVVYAVERIGLSATQWGLILFVETAVRNVAGVPAGILVDRHGRTRYMLGSMALLLVSVPLFVLAQGFAAVLLIRFCAGVANAFFLPACAALMADLTPRDIRGRVMAALGRGSVLMGTTGGGTGGPGLGFLVTIPLMLAALSAGYLYTWNPRSPWYLTAATLVASLTLTALYIRDPQRAEI